jgi:hypothetical protein
VANDTVFTVFEDFNEPRDDPPPSPPPDDPSIASSEVGEIRETAWTEGYLTGRQESGSHNSDQPLTAKLLTSVYELASETSGAVDAASLAVAELLVNTIITMASDGWSARLLERVQMVADRIKPALTVAPDFVLRDQHGTEQHFDDISDLSRVLEAGASGEDVTIRWQRGEATISRAALLDDLRDAIIPLSAGPLHQPEARSLK